jgi:hypothetical protein
MQSDEEVQIGEVYYLTWNPEHRWSVTAPSESPHALLRS